jgi:hypothetical protein
MPDASDRVLCGDGIGRGIIMDDLAKHERLWFIASRWQQYRAEGRANLLRVLAVGVFYAIQLVYYYGLDSQERHQNEVFQQQATALAAAAILLSLAVMVCLRASLFPGWLMYASTLGDIVIVSALAAVGSGPQSPMVIAYFVILAITALRFSIPLVGCATATCMVGYLAVVALTHPGWLGNAKRSYEVPLVKQAVFLASLALCGLILGQAIRRVRAMADWYQQRVAGLDSAEARIPEGESS